MIQIKNINGDVIKNYEGANLRDADLVDADLEVPKIHNIHQKVYEAAKAEGALSMLHWHENGFCGTTHCRAGWVTNLAGKAGKELEDKVGCSSAAYLIYRKSDPDRSFTIDFYCDNEKALEDMRLLAEAEKNDAK